MIKVVGVTGATGNIGRVLVKKLAEKKYKVKALVRTGSKITWENNSGIEIIRGDVTDTKTLKSFLKGCDFVVHLAVVMDSSLSEEIFKSVNVGSVKEILKLADKKTKLVMVSSVTVYKSTGKTERDEAFDLRKTVINDKYAESKIKALKLVRSSPRKVVSVMPSVVIDKDSFGREEVVLSSPLRRWIWSHIGGGIPGGIMAAVGSKNRVISVIEVNDVVDGIIMAMEKGKEGREYILTGQNIKAGEYLKKIAALAGKNYLKIRIPMMILPLFGLSPLQDMAFSAERARKELGFKPKWQL